MKAMCLHGTDLHTMIITQATLAEPIRRHLGGHRGSISALNPADFVVGVGKRRGQSSVSNKVGGNGGFDPYGSGCYKQRRDGGKQKVKESVRMHLKAEAR